MQFKNKKDRKNQSYTCLGPKRIKKSAEILGVLGGLDELSCLLGVVRAFNRKEVLDKSLSGFQDDLHSIGGWLSGVTQTIELEQKIKKLEAMLFELNDSNLKKFTRPGKNQVSAFLHLSRVATRRLEREVVRQKNQRYRLLVNYFNRLSSVIFWLAVKEDK